MSDELRTHHENYMRHALRLAMRGLGSTSPNPSVGAVIVKEGQIVGCGWTARGGRPHAETTALEQAKNAARGADMYVTLEPCVHQGKTPPCTQAIIASGIKRVFTACIDPYPVVSGKGLDELRAAGIEVVDKICEAEASRINEGFFSIIRRKRPFVTVKIATSLDGKIATADGKSRWITGEAARAQGHYLRATHDAILTGIGTVIADNPSLTCRLPGREIDSPQRVVVDSQLRMPLDAKVLPAWIFTAPQAQTNHKEKADALMEKGARIFTVNFLENNAYLSLEDILAQLANMGITRLMVEGGSELTTGFIMQEFADRIYWFRAPSVIGENGLNALKGKKLTGPSDMHYHLISTRSTGNDVLEIYEHKEY